MDASHFVHRSAQRFPERPLWLTPERVITYSEGSRRVSCLANALLDRAAQQDRVAILSINRFEGLESLLAVLTARMVGVSMSARLSPDEHTYMIQDSEATIVIFGEEFRSGMAALREKCLSVRHWICVGRQETGEESYEDLIASSPADRPNLSIQPEDLAELFYTSGTTGRPKGVMETHRNLVTMTQQFLLGVVPGLNEQDVTLHAAPISHASGAFMFPHIAVGAANAFPLSRKFDAAKFFEAVELYGVTTVKLVPTMVNILVQSGLAPSYDLSTLRYMAYGGAPMYLPQLLEAMRSLGPILVQNYGQGEAPSTCAALTREDHVLNEDPVAQRRLTSVGRELPGVRIRIADAEDRAMPAGQTGEIQIRSDLVMSGYWKQPDATAAALRDGWLRTGDVGYLDNDGYLYITSRLKDMIISGGFNIYAREVEDVICAHPAVKDAAVIGVPDPKWGEVVLAAVVVREQARLSEQELIEFCVERLASYKKPQIVVFEQALPVNGTGKVDKKVLQAKMTRKGTNLMRPR